MNKFVIAVLLIVVCCVISHKVDGSSEQLALCSMPLETGPCRALLKRYGYNPTTQACEEFIYGGCKGNENNFLTLDDCQVQCDGSNS